MVRPPYMNKILGDETEDHSEASQRSSSHPAGCTIARSASSCAKAMGTPLINFVQMADTTHYWKMQYDFDFTCCVLSEANIYQGPTDDLLMPLALPKPAGRPRTSRKRSAMERAAGRRPPGAEGKARKQYICKKCGQPKRGHTCTAGN